MTTPAQPPPQDHRRLASGVLGVLLIAATMLVVWAVLGRNGTIQNPLTPNVVTSNGNKKADNAYLKTDEPGIKASDLGPRKWKIVDAHEHVQSEVEAKQLLEAMDKYGIARTCLMASTTYTLTLSQKYGFEGFKENNEALIAIKKKWPDRFAAFVTLNPEDTGNLALLQDYVARGADGLKLYLGHGASTGKGPFHAMPLDDARMEPIWAWAEQVQLPITLHVNLTKYWDEFLRVMEKHPYLRMNIPHMGLQKNTLARLVRLSWLLDRYPNLYTDVSFGFYTFQLEGFETLAKWRTRSRAFFRKYEDRVLYASDMVLEPTKDEPYILDTLRSYLQFLELDKWRLFLVPTRTMHGMALDDDTLKGIYERAPAAFLLTDASGHLPDRTKGWPVPGTPEPPRNPIAPLASVTIPPATLPAAVEQQGTFEAAAAWHSGQGGKPASADAPRGPDDDTEGTAQPPPQGGSEHEAHGHADCEGEPQP